jgi:hypothetical protein
MHVTPGTAAYRVRQESSGGVSIHVVQGIKGFIGRVQITLLATFDWLAFHHPRMLEHPAIIVECPEPQL